MSATRVIAVDLGASSGRVIEVSFDGQRLDMRELRRFPNIPVMTRGTLYWDVLRLWHEIEEGLRELPPGLRSIGVDSWGVDFALLDHSGQLLANPIHYRDASSDAGLAMLGERMPRREIYERTGIQFMAPNGLNRMLALAAHNPALYEAAASMLSIADLFHYWLSGAQVCEYTIATTWQLYNPRTQVWDKEIARAMGIPERILPSIVAPGTQIGTYREVPVIVPASHDTGSAVVAVPSTTRNFAYISSGTWSLLGLELDQPIFSDEAYAANATNEGGLEGTFRFLRNIMGLWLVQQCRETWEDQGQSYTYAELVALAESVDPFRSLIDPDDDRFYPPGDMPARIRDFCREHSEPVPENTAQVMATIYASLAFKYRQRLDELVRASGQAVDRVHIIGGGSQNALLCQMTANATNRPVYAGPVEATALGNAIVQLMALGELGTQNEARALLAESMVTHIYEPRDAARWHEEYERFIALTN